MSLVLKEDVDYIEITTEAVSLCEFVMHKYNIKTFSDWLCPYFKALAKELYREVEDDDES